MKKLVIIVMVLSLMSALFSGCMAKDDNISQDLSSVNDSGLNDSYSDQTENPDASNSEDNQQDGDSSDLAYILEKGTLIVGITDYAPMDFKDDNGEWTGFDAEFARAVGTELGVEIIFQEIQWSSKFFELEAKTIDCIWNGMTISDDVLLNTSCSNPYVKNAQVVVMKADRAGAYADAASMTELVFAVEEGSAGESALVDNNLTNYIPVYDQATAVMEVAAGTADACVIDLTMANAMTGAGTSYEDLTKVMELTSEEYGVGFRKDSDVTVKFNEIMARMMTDGTLDALAEKYQLTLVKGN